MKNETVTSDITVVGGGLAGICAAIAAARLGKSVALVHNRPVLGGNSSSEVRVWVCGATGHGVNRYARETGIMGELFLENQFRNMEGNPYLWDLTLLEAVKAEPHLSLYLNTDVHEVHAEGPEEDRNIQSVTGWMMGSERKIEFRSRLFLDCTGDGLVGALAGAKYRIGRESTSEFGEPWAPEKADTITLGSTLLFYTKDAGEPVRFIPPSFAKDITQTSIPLRRIIRSGDNGCAYWWIEWGGELDTVHDNERIRDELWAVIYGIWDYIKNSGNFAAENLTLEWVGSLPGKREYRRFIGDYTLTQHDILAQRPFEDRIAFGGWSIDLHPPGGVYAEEQGSKHWFADGIYHIPFRSIYSVNVNNLLFAGRNISASHVAFGTTRVMATCAILGEAAGTAAALCETKSVTPRKLGRLHLAELQRMLLRQDASIIGLKADDPADLASQAAVRASSTLAVYAPSGPFERILLEADFGILVPVDGRLTDLQLLTECSAATILIAELYTTGRKENYVPHTAVQHVEIPLRPGEPEWVQVPLDWTPEEASNAFIVIKANPHVALFTSSHPLTGVLCFQKGEPPVVSAEYGDRQPPQPVQQWSAGPFSRRPLCFRLPTGRALDPDKVIDGFNRPYGGPHCWVSEPLAEGEAAWIELQWEQEVSIREIHLTFQDDVNEDLINLHHHRTPFQVIPELVKDYRIEAHTPLGTIEIVNRKNNRRRKNIHRLDHPISASSLRLIVESTNGSPRAEVVEIRVYPTSSFGR
ncbi:FAD-dependent oxidoreductase [Paenibacillus sp. alder61]|uniref:FAD-dependent oxidoreductase n=1 Tax=Paenibacillus faecis TaxID=862114 RepID=A0A5D0CK08_9BACL|nr:MULTISPECIES: FAD-dependent oxidoreductase [Paenibacillus]MCA1295369.1 FAD-dependent oxidoreductase [Paenibacillus sp. alder61]TYA10248.1 FAD-dependent oxidoreductase [Paenibacillus faecis]